MVADSSKCAVVDEAEITTGVGVHLDLHGGMDNGRADLLFEPALDPCRSRQQEEEDLGYMLHLAVKNNSPKMVSLLLQRIRQMHKLQEAQIILNWRDVDGNTALHLSAVAKQPQVLEELLGSKLVDVNALNSLHLTPMDMLYSSPCPRKIEDEIKGILRRAGGLRAHEILTNHQNNAREAPNLNHSPDGTKGSSEASTNLLLLLATVAAYVTYHAAFHLPAATTSHDRAESGIYSLLSSYFVFCNSLVFVASVVTSISLLQSFPFKPWPQVSLVSLFCSYALSVAAKSRSQGVVALLLFSLPCLMAVLGKLHGSAKPIKASPGCKLNYLSC